MRFCRMLKKSSIVITSEKKIKLRGNEKNKIIIYIVGNVVGALFCVFLYYIGFLPR